MDVNLPRWLMASVRNHFYDRRGGVYLHFEGTGSRNTKDDAGNEIIQWAELRVDGPYQQIYTLRDTAYILEVNLLIMAGVNDVETNAIDRLMGLFGAAFTNCISVFKYGDGPDDDQSQIGHLKLIPSKTGEVQFTRFGQVGPDTRFLQASIEGHYKMNYTS